MSRCIVLALQRLAGMGGRFQLTAAAHTWPGARVPGWYTAGRHVPDAPWPTMHAIVSGTGPTARAMPGQRTMPSTALPASWLGSACGIPLACATGHGRTRPASAHPDAATTPPPCPPRTVVMAAPPSARQGDGLQLSASVREVFLPTMHADLVQLRAAMDSRQRGRMLQWLHRIRGALVMAACPALAADARRAEETIQRGAPMADCLRACSCFSTRLDRALQQLAGGAAPGVAGTSP